MNKQWIPVIITFAMVYILLFLMGNIFRILNPWDSVFYYIMPVCGFFFTILFLDSFKNHVNVKVFIIFLIITLLFGFYLVNYLYYFEMVGHSNAGDQKTLPYICFFELLEQDCQNNASMIGQNQSVTFVPIHFWTKVRQSPFTIFMLSAIFAAIIQLIIPKEEKE